jgi:predicted dehydrogenase
MEAVWTRFQPLVIEIERLVRDEKAIGDVRRVYADLGFDADLPNLPADSRMISPKLAGGGLLDLGPYPLLWALLV